MIRAVPLIATATFNEIDNLPTLVDRVLEQVPSAHLLVIDDQSPDGTGAWCRRRASEDDRITCIVREGKLGLGTAHMRAMEFTLKHGYSQLVTMDADLSHDPGHLPAMLTAAEHHEVVIGSRYVAGGGTEGWPWRRKMMSRTVNWYARRMLRLPARDCSGAFRVYDATALRRIRFDQIAARGYAFFEEVLWHLVRSGASVCEVPIVFREREYGSSKINLREALTAVTLIGQLGFAARWNRTPLESNPGRRPRGPSI